MKKGKYLLCLLIFVFISACGGKQSTSSPETTPTTTIADALPTSTEDASIVLPPAPEDPGESSGEDNTGEEAESPSDPNQKLYDPSIFVIEASGSYQTEPEPGYFINYEVEIYLDKVDSNDNRVVTGSYQGGLWINEIVDAKEYIKNTFGNLPMTIQFDAGGEAVTDNFAVYLSTEDDKAWVDYSILDDQGNPLPLTRDMPVAKGSTIAMVKSAYLDAVANGAQGEKVDYHDTAEGETIDINYVIHVEENSAEVNALRKVTIQLSGEGFSFTIEGTLTRLPGYAEDVLEYANNEKKSKFMEHFH